MAENESGFMVDCGRSSGPDKHLNATGFSITDGGHLLLWDDDGNKVAAYTPGKWLRVKLSSQPSW